MTGDGECETPAVAVGQRDEYGDRPDREDDLDRSTFAGENLRIYRVDDDVESETIKIACKLASSWTSAG